MTNSAGMSNFKMILMEHGVVLRRHKWIALAAAWTVCVLGWTGVMMMPRQYQSDARAFVDVNGLLTPLLRGLVVDNNTAQNSEYLRQTLLSRPNLEQVLSLAQLDGNSSDAEKEALIDDLSTSVKVAPQGRNLFTISYNHQDPVTAKNVVEALLTIFAEKASSSNRVEMEKARKFLDDQIAAYEEQMRAAEVRRAEFRKDYWSYLSDPVSGVPRLQALATQMEQARLAYNQALATRDSLQAQLKQVPAMRSVNAMVGPDGRVSVNPITVRLAQAEASLATLRLKYTDQHPDVVSAQNAIAEMKSQIQAEVAAASAEGNGASASTMTEIANPTYEQISLRLVDAQTVIPAAKQRLDQATVEFERMRRMAAAVPDIDAKATDLDRDYDVIKKNHDELIERRESATLSQAADDQADRTQFRIVDPPQTPIKPSFPNLPVMFSFVLLIGLAAGAGLPIVLGLVRATFGSSMRLRDLGLPVIGSVTLAGRSSGGRGFVIGTLAAFGTAAALLGVYGALLVFSSVA